MRLSINREALLKPLQLVAGIVERRQTLPVLSNILLDIDEKTLSLTGSDLEVELIGKVELADIEETGTITVPARKLMDICKSLPENSEILINQEGERVVLRSERSQFTLSTLPARDYPNIDEEYGSLSFSMEQTSLRYLIERTGFAMAQQDVRYYLNGMLLEVSNNSLKAVATDGHRLAMCTLEADTGMEKKQQFIIPRKGIMGLGRLIAQDKGKIDIVLGNNHIRAKTGEFTFTSKLVDGEFPDYERAIPRRGGDKVVLIGRDVLKQALNRAAILSNEKYGGVRLIFDNNTLKIMANNPEQEKAEEEVTIDYTSDPMEIGFNVHYILSALSAFTGDTVSITLSNPDNSALIEDPEDGASLYVIMPMRF